MKHEIDLSKYEVRTDLIVESLIDKKITGIVTESNDINGIKIDEICIEKCAEEFCNKKSGKYITISFDDVTDSYNQSNLESVFTTELKKFLEYMKVNSNDKCLVIGLGNPKSTPDSLGPKVVESILVTKHLFDISEIEVSKNYRNVSSIIPNVTGVTGIDTKDIILGIINMIKPDFVILVDALASLSIDRVNKTIQMTDTGIYPGSGVGNTRGELSIETLGVKTLAIGVPTVVDAVTIVSDTINYLTKKIGYSKKNMNNLNDKLKVSSSINYLKGDNSITKSDRKKLLGYIGNLTDDEIKQLIFEVLTPIGYNMMVTPKEVDFIVDKISIVISNSINKSLHKNINIFEKK